MVTAAPAAGAVPAERSPALLPPGRRRERPAQGLAVAGRVLVALAVAAAVAGAWLDPRFDYLVDDGCNHAVRVGLFDALLRRAAPPSTRAGGPTSPWATATPC